MKTSVAPYAVQRDDIEERSFFGSRTWFLADGEQTGGELGLLEHVVPPGAGSPWHVHHKEDESFYVIEGEILFIVGEEHQRITAKAGSFVFGPREIPHGFINAGEKPARMLLQSIPAGFEQFAYALSAPRDTPPGPPDMDRLLAEAAKQNIEILGPLPE
jgi:quercetin dioxygenase-like cupin family protein